MFIWNGSRFQLETIEVAKEENEIIAALSLLGIGIKSVPQPVLRKKFSECGTLLDDLFEKFVAKDNINQSVLRAVSLFEEWKTRVKEEVY